MWMFFDNQETGLLEMTTTTQQNTNLNNNGSNQINF